MRMNRVLPLVVAGGLALYGVTRAEHADASVPLSPPADFALEDIEGKWHIVAHIPYFLEKNRVAPEITFTRREDGRLDEVFSAQKGGFDAPRKSVRQLTWAPDPARPWMLKTRLFKVIPARYQVLHVDEDAGIALLGTADRDKAWIFKRTPRLDEKELRRALARFEAQGFDVARILRIPQRPADLGKAGYASIDD